MTDQTPPDVPSANEKMDVTGDSGDGGDGSGTVALNPSDTEQGHGDAAAAEQDKPAAAAADSGDDQTDKPGDKPSDTSAPADTAEGGPAGEPAASTEQGGETEDQPAGTDGDPADAGDTGKTQATLAGSGEAPPADGGPAEGDGSGAEDSTDSGTPVQGEAATPRSRVTRSQNPDFAAKQKNFMKEYQRSVSGAPSASEPSAIAASGITPGPSRPEKRPSTSSTEDTAPTAANGSAKKRRTSKSEDETAEVPAASATHPAGTGVAAQNDNFCWVCHREGKVVCCETCPRVYHLKCANLSTDPPGDWVCVECRRVVQAENVDNLSPSMKLVTHEQFIQLLTYAIGRLKGLPGAEPFISPVDVRKFPTYREFVACPMDLSTMETSTKKGMYGSTEAFVADCKWIVHNCILFNGTTSKLTTLAKSLLRMCKWEMEEIETCPHCYGHAYTNDNWFTMACPHPHLLIWARLKGFPYWPAKAVKTRDGNVDCRFFGRHDRAYVPVKECFLFSREPPAPPKSRSKSLDACVEELEEHVKNLERKFGKFVYAKIRTPYNPKKITEQLKMMIPGYQCNVTRPDQGHEPAKRKRSNSEIQLEMLEKLRQGKKARKSVSATLQENKKAAAAAAAAEKSGSDQQAAEPAKSGGSTAQLAKETPAVSKPAAASEPAETSKAAETPAAPAAAAEPDDSNSSDTADRLHIDEDKRKTARKSLSKSRTQPPTATAETPAKSAPAPKTTTAAATPATTTPAATAKPSIPAVSAAATATASAAATSSTSSVSTVRAAGTTTTSTAVKKQIKLSPASAAAAVSRSVAGQTMMVITTATPAGQTRVTGARTNGLSAAIAQPRLKPVSAGVRMTVSPQSAGTGTAPGAAGSIPTQQSIIVGGKPGTARLLIPRSSLNQLYIPGGQQKSGGVTGPTDPSQFTIMGPNSIGPMMVIPGPLSSSVGSTPAVVNYPAVSTVSVTAGSTLMTSVSEGAAPADGSAAPTPPEAGPISAELNKQAQSLSDMMRSSLEKVLNDLSLSGSPHATVANLKLQIERLQWKHQMELAEQKKVTDTMLAELRNSMEIEKTKALNKLTTAFVAERKDWERQTELKVAETKKKQWCANCGKEAIFYCCWNTSYCDFPCQEAQWPKHMQTCANQQGQHQAAVDAGGSMSDNSR